MRAMRYRQGHENRRLDSLEHPGAAATPLALQGPRRRATALAPGGAPPGPRSLHQSGRLMAWLRVEEGIYRAVNPVTSRPWPGLFIKLSIRGKPAFVSAKTRNLKVARLRRADRQLRGQRGEAVLSGKLTVALLCDQLQTHYEVNATWNRNKRYALDLIRRELGTFHPAGLVTEHHDHIEAMQARWIRAGMTPATVNRYSNYLRRALRWAQIKGRLGTIPIVSRLDESGSRRGKMLPAEDADRLLPALASW